MQTSAQKPTSSRRRLRPAPQRRRKLVASAPVRHANLPAELTSFIGREEQVVQVCGTLRTAPLVTLAGTGGVGKTRLALHAAAAVRPNYAYGAWLVELAPVADPEQVPAAVAAALGLRERPRVRDAARPREAAEDEG